MKETCPTCGHEGDEITCDFSADNPPRICEDVAVTYCDGCECWRCEKHECECGKDLE